MSEIIALLGTGYFVMATIIGVVAVAAIWIVSLSRRSWVRPVPVVGVVVAIATVVTVQSVEGELDPAIYPGLIAIFVLVGLAVLLKAPRWAQGAAAIPGATWLAVNTNVTELTWGRFTLGIAIPVAGALIGDFEQRHEGLGLGVVYYALSALGVFGAIPDTEWALALIGVTWVVVFSAWPRVVASIGPVGAYMAVAVLVWVALHGGAAREASIVGSVACLGILLVEPVLTYLRPSFVRVSKWVRGNWVGAIVAAMPQFILVLICSRIAARFTDPPPALTIVGFAFVGAFLVGWIVADVRRDDQLEAG